MANALATFLLLLFSTLAMAGEGAPAREGNDMLIGTIGIGLVLFLLGLLFIARKLFTILLNLGFVLIGATLVLLAVFAKPLGIYDWMLHGVERWFTPQPQKTATLLQEREGAGLQVSRART